MNDIDIDERDYLNELEHEARAADLTDEVSARMEKAVVASLQGSANGFEYVPVTPIGWPQRVGMHDSIDVLVETLSFPEVVEAFHALMRDPAAAKFCAVFAAAVVRSDAAEVAEVLLTEAPDAD